LSVGFAFTMPNSDRRGICGGVDIETVIAGFQNREGLIGRVDFISFAAEQMTDVQIQRALIQFHLDQVVAHVRERHAGLGVESQRCATQMQLGARGLVGPDAIGGG
jgi:hypothetical protein